MKPNKHRLIHGLSLSEIKGFLELSKIWPHAGPISESHRYGPQYFGSIIVSQFPPPGDTVAGVTAPHPDNHNTATITKKISAFLNIDLPPVSVIAYTKDWCEADDVEFMGIKARKILDFGPIGR